MVAITNLPDGNVRIHVECRLKARANRRYIQLPASTSASSSPQDATPIVQLIGKALTWKELLVSGTYRKMQDLASALDLCEAYIRDVLRLAYLSTFVIEKIVRGDLPGASVTKHSALNTLIWTEQEERIATL